MVVSALLPSAGDASEMSGELNDWTSTTRDFVLVVVLLTPLQAAGEEYAFRGYLTQAFGGLFAPLGPQVSRAAAVLLPATLFALAHGAQDAPIFIDRFAFGLVAGILVITTGGLEAGIAMHVLNNFLAFGAALAYSDMTTALTPTDGELVAAADDAHPVGRLPGARDLGGETRRDRPDHAPAFGGPRGARVMFRLGLGPFGNRAIHQ